MRTGREDSCPSILACPASPTPPCQGVQPLTGVTSAGPEAPGRGSPNNLAFQIGNPSEGWWLTQPLNEMEPALNPGLQHLAPGHLISCQWDKGRENIP